MSWDQTRNGAKFFGDVGRIADALEAIAREMKRANDKEGLTARVKNGTIEYEGKEAT